MNESIIGERFGRLVVVGYHHSNKYKFEATRRAETLPYSELIMME